MQNFHASYNCEFKLYMKDKSRNYGLLFQVLPDAQDRYASRKIPYVTPLINNREKIVMNSWNCYKNIERCVKGQEKHYWRPVLLWNWYYWKTLPARIYLVTIMPDRKGLQVFLKINHYLQNCPVMIVSYCPKKNTNVLLVSSALSEQELWKIRHKKSVVIDFYNSQKCWHFKSSVSRLY